MRGILINMYQLVAPKQRELKTKITVREPGEDREGGSLKSGNKPGVPLNSDTEDILFKNLLLTLRGESGRVTRRASASNKCIVIDLHFHI